MSRHRAQRLCERAYHCRRLRGAWQATIACDIGRRREAGAAGRRRCVPRNLPGTIPWAFAQLAAKTRYPSI